MKNRPHSAVTIRDIATTCGFSPSTVAAVLGDKPHCYVSKESRATIKETAERLGYTPNLAAKILRRLPTQTIGFITGIGEASAPLLQTITGLARRRYGYTILVINHLGLRREETKILLTDFLNRGLDGMIVSSFAPLEEIRGIVGDRVPFCFLNRSGRGLECVSRDEPDVLGIDIEYGGYAQTSHLVRLGHRKIAYVGDPLSNKQKVEGFARALKENGLEMSDANVFSTRDSAMAMAVGQTLIEKRFTAVVASNDLIALATIEDLRKHGVRVPEDFAVIGYDNTPFCEFIRPRLSSISVPFERLGEAVVDSIVRKIQEPVEIPFQLFRPELVVRESCGATLNERNNS